MKRLWLWLRLLTKRHFARPAFLVILLLIPLFTGALALAAQGDSGVVTISLCAGESELGKNACAGLKEQPGVLRFLVVDEPEEATDAVSRGQADAAWIFLDDVEERLRHFVRSGTGAAVLVVEREENVFLRLARERLFSQLYPAISWAVFLDCAETSFDEAPEELLRESYDTVFNDAPIFEMTYVNGEARTGSENVLTSPIRGILALLTMLSALAAALGSSREEAAGCYDLLPRTAARLAPLANAFTGALPVALCSLPALALAGLWTNTASELAAALMLSVSAAGFAELVRTLCRKERIFAAAVPLLMLLMAALCPVFLGVIRVRAVQLLLPPFYAIHAAHTPVYLFWFALYTLALYALTIPLRLLRASAET